MQKIILNLIEEIKQIEVLNYHVAYYKYSLHSEKDFFNTEWQRKNNLKEDWIYFNSLKEIIEDNNLTPNDMLLKIKEIEAPEGCLSHYFDSRYTKIAKSLTNQAIELLGGIETEEKEAQKDEELIKLYKLQQIQTKKLINTEELLVLLSISKGFLDKLRKRQKPLPDIGGGSGGVLMFNKEAVEEWIEKYL